MLSRLELNADIAAILQTEISDYLNTPPANPEEFWTYLASIIIATPGMTAIIHDADETRSQYQQELARISAWQLRFRERADTAEATIARIEAVAKSMEDTAEHGAFISRDPYEYTIALREALNPSKDN